MAPSQVFGLRASGPAWLTRSRVCTVSRSAKSITVACHTVLNGGFQSTLRHGAHWWRGCKARLAALSAPCYYGALPSSACVVGGKAGGATQTAAVCHAQGSLLAHGPCCCKAMVSSDTEIPDVEAVLPLFTIWSGVDPLQVLPLLSQRCRAGLAPRLHSRAALEAK